MKYSLIFLLVVFAACNKEQPVAQIPSDPPKTPPFGGTIFIDADIVLPSDPTSFTSISFTGQESREMFDRRVDGWITVEAYLFIATFEGADDIEIQVNPEFGENAASNQAEKYAPFIGQLPSVLRKDVNTVWIHAGTNPFGGGNNNLLIHTGQGEDYISDGILEETLIHEAAHTSLDAEHASSTGWIAAQNADNVFISTYARDNSTREDIAESFVPYFAVKYRSDRISEELKSTILQTMPNRIKYFDDQSFNMFPVE